MQLICTFVFAYDAKSRFFMTQLIDGNQVKTCPGFHTSSATKSPAHLQQQVKLSFISETKGRLKVSYNLNNKNKGRQGTDRVCLYY